VAAYVFNIAKGRAVELYNNVKSNSPANSAFIVVLLKTTGLDAEDTMNNFDDLAAVLAANDECDFTNYARKTLTDSDIAALPAPDDTNNRRDLDLPDLVYTSPGGASNNTVGAVLVCYDADTTGGADSAIVPISLHELSWTTDGNNTTIAPDAAGFFRAS